jgi:hypothetical protein
MADADRHFLFMTCSPVVALRASMRVPAHPVIRVSFHVNLSQNIAPAVFASMRFEVPAKTVTAAVVAGGVREFYNRTNQELMQEFLNC